MLDQKDRRVLAAAVACFILAGLSGVFFRFGMSGQPTWGFTLENIRHAHSHLMYFSWATPALMILLVPRDKWIRLNAWIGLVLGIVSYPFFLNMGYDVMTIGSSTMPPAAMISGMIMFTWYGFLARWIWVKRSEHSNWAPMETISVVFLMLSSIGAWGISFTVPLGLSNPAWIEAFKHLFLGFFTEGWLTLACVSILIRRLTSKDGAPDSIPTFVQGLLVVGIGFSYILGMPSNLVRESVQWVAKGSAILAGVALVWISVMLWRRMHVASRAGDFGQPHGADQGTKWWNVPILALGMKGLSLAVIAPWPGIWWADQHQDRILFLHLLLLGIVSMTIVLSIVRHSRAAVPYTYSVILLLAFLVPVSSFWIFPSIAMTWIYLIGGVSLLPVVTSGFIIQDLIRS